MLHGHPSCPPASFLPAWTSRGAQGESLPSLPSSSQSQNIFFSWVEDEGLPREACSWRIGKWDDDFPGRWRNTTLWKIEQLLGGFRSLTGTLSPLPLSFLPPALQEWECGSPGGTRARPSLTAGVESGITFTLTCPQTLWSEVSGMRLCVWDRQGQC